MSDVIDAAMQAPVAVQVVKLQGRLSTGGPFLVAVPENATDMDILELVTRICAQLPAALHERRSPTPRLYVPRGVSQ